MRQKAWRNMIVAGINAGLEQKWFGFGEHEHLWPNAKCEGIRLHTEGYFFNFEFEVEGVPACAEVNPSSDDDLRIAVVFWPIPKPVGVGCQPSSAYLRCVGEAHACGILRRCEGEIARLHKYTRLFSCHNHIRQTIAAMKIEPRGYKAD